MRRIYFFLIALVLPVFSFGVNIFNPPAINNGTDLSIQYLGDLFGVVDGVLSGSGSQIMGQMFMVFNSGALVLGGIIVIYTTLISIMNTAHEGEMLGKKWNSIWIPLRTVLGVALLIPKSTGYCAIQIFMMWVIVQGAGLADTVWGKVTGYLVQGGVIVQPGIGVKSNVGEAAQGIFLQTICLQGMQNQFNAAYLKATSNNESPPAVPSFLGSMDPLPNCKGPNCTVTLPNFPSCPDCTYDWSKLNGVCGAIKYTVSDKDTSLATANASAVRTGIQQMLLDTSGSAQSVVGNSIYPPKGVIPSNPSSYLPTNLFLQAGSAYEGIVNPSAKALAGDANTTATTSWIESAEKNGWITAGQFYQQMSSANSAGSASFKPPSSSFSADNIQKTIDGAGLPASLNDNLKLNDLIGVLEETGAVNGVKVGQNLKTYIADAPTSEGAKGGGGKGVKQGSLDLGGIVAAIMEPLAVPLINVIKSFTELMAAQSFNTNPIETIAQLGDALVSLVAEVWIAGAITIAVATGALAAIPFVAEGVTVPAAVDWIIPLLWAIAGTLFIEGAIMAYYVPMIPFIIFLFGAIGWIVATLEAMVAAPLIALGITHPEGQEVLGKADPAVLLLVNVFLRPSMMIIGFVGGIMLSYISLWLLNVGFSSAFAEGPMADGLKNLSIIAWIFSIPMMFILYVGIVIALMNYCFSLINVIPDKVLRWIGGQVEGVAGEAGRMAGEVKAGAEKGAGAVGTGVGKVAEAMGGRSDKATKAEAGELQTGGNTTAKSSPPKPPGGPGGGKT